MGGLLHQCPDLAGDLPVPLGLHQQKQNLQSVGPAQVVAQPGQLRPEVPHISPLPHGDHREGCSPLQAGGGQPLFQDGVRPSPLPLAVVQRQQRYLTGVHTFHRPFFFFSFEKEKNQKTKPP